MSRKAVLERTLGKKGAKRFIPKAPKKSPLEDVKLEISSEVIEQLVLHELFNLHGSLTKDLEDREADVGFPVFERDREMDIAMLKGHLFAIETVLRYYTTPDQFAKLLPHEGRL